MRQLLLDLALQPGLGVRSHCRFRTTGAGYVCESGVKGMSGRAKRQCDLALESGLERAATVSSSLNTVSNPFTQFPNRLNQFQTISNGLKTVSNPCKTFSNRFKTVSQRFQTVFKPFSNHFRPFQTVSNTSRAATVAARPSQSTRSSLSESSSCAGRIITTGHRWVTMGHDGSCRRHHHHI